MALNQEKGLATAPTDVNRMSQMVRGFKFQ